MISIVVPAYNAEKFLSKCLNSILEQTFSEFEIILINDGSTDKTLIICEEFVKKDSRIILVNQENQGVASSRNTGITLARYPYVTFIDSDDWVEITYLEVLFDLMTKYDADISICGYYLEDLNRKKNQPKQQSHKDQRVFQYSRKEALSLLFLDDRIQHYSWSKLYKKHLFDGIKYPENTYYEDVFTTYKIFGNADKIVQTNEKLLHYIKHGANITCTASLVMNLDCCNAFLDQLHYIRENKDQLENARKIQFLMAKQFYRLKKSITLNFDLDSEMFLDQEKAINAAMRKAIKPIWIFIMKPLFLLKYFLAIRYPKVFLQYLTITRPHNK